MTPDHRHKLHFGPYAAPRFRFGATVDDETRGSVIVCGLSDAPIPWPLGRLQGRSSRGPIIYRDLAKAIRRESSSAICFWWSVTPQTVTRWRKLLGVPMNNEGERRLRAENGRRNWPKVKPKFHAKTKAPERRRKIREARLGKRRSPDVIDKMRRAMLGTSLSPATRAKMSAVHKARGTRPPRAGRPWTAEEDAIVRESSGKDAAAKLKGRTLKAVWIRRSQLKRTLE